MREGNELHGVDQGLIVNCIGYHLPHKCLALLSLSQQLMAPKQLA